MEMEFAPGEADSPPVLLQNLCREIASSPAGDVLLESQPVSTYAEFVFLESQPVLHLFEVRGVCYICSCSGELFLRS